MSDQLTLVFVTILAYGLGSIPFGLVFTRLSGKGDIRQTGSGNIGATNVLRTGSKLLALATLLADAAKGFVAVAVAWRLAGDQGAMIAAVLSLLGHVFPVWLNFKGGKGVAVFIGAMLMLSPLTGLVFLAVWALVAVFTRRSSLAALVALACAPLVLFVLGEMLALQACVIMVLLCFWAHRENISRLVSGTEPKIGQ
jgi:glycerol-3-phosphate acyltransferase PlsY